MIDNTFFHTNSIDFLIPLYFPLKEIPTECFHTVLQIRNSLKNRAKR